MIKSTVFSRNLFFSKLFLVGLGLIAGFCCIAADNKSSDKKNTSKQLVNVEYDFTQQKDNKMQLGTVAFYFKQQPIVNELPQREDKNKAVFFFPMAQVSAQMYPKIEKMLADNATDSFSVKLEKVMRPIPGLMLTIAYDPQKVSIQRIRQRSMDADPGVAFNFYNKSLIEHLQIQDKEMLKITFDIDNFLSSRKGGFITPI